MNVIRYLAILAVASVVTGCSMTDITSSIKGNHYIETGNYDDAEVTFRHLVEQDPSSAINQYYLGRFLLAQNNSEEALSHFQKAVTLDRTDTDNNFWLGVAYGELGDLKAEKTQYERTLKLSSSYTRARLYLGHSQLRDGELTKALRSYDKVLKSIPTNAGALYNRALVLDLQKQKKDAKKAWLEYLKWFPAGAHAIRAADNLNALGNFSYENHYLGIRTVTLRKIGFKNRSDTVSVESIASLRLVGTIVSNLEKGNLQIVVYESDVRKSAQRRAINLRKKILELSPALTPERVWISWFNEPDVITKNGVKQSNKNSVRLFLSEWE